MSIKDLLASTRCSLLLIASIGLIGSTPPRALPQQLSAETIENPIYIADSPIASDSLEQISLLITQHNLDEATRLADQIITKYGDRLIESDPPGVYIHIRARLERFLIEHPALLENYRKRITPAAWIWLEADDWERVARDAYLTEPGMIASLHSAQTLIESAHFYSGQRILHQLETHPDADALANKASTLALMNANALNTQESWALVDRWAALGGIEPPDRAEQRHTLINRSAKIAHPQAVSLVWNADEKSRSITLDGIVPQALQSAILTPESQLDEMQDQNQNSLSGANWVPSAWVSPVVVNNLLYTNDGITISCFDRFTLRPLWRLQTARDSTDLPITPDARARLGRVIEDTTTITAIGDELYVPAGLPRAGLRTGNSDLLKLDAKSGTIIWASNIAQLDESLADASIRGQVIVDEGIVLLEARTNNRRQRLINIAIVALDSATGKLLWIRQIGSAGSLPFQQVGQLAHSPILHHGVAYWTDHIGLAFAIDTATGRVLWAKPMPPPNLHSRFFRPPFATNTPVLAGASGEPNLFALSTDGTKIIELDLESGRMLAERPADPIGESLYLLSLGDTIACVSPFRIAYYAASRFENAKITRSPPLGGSDGIRGRVIVAGDRLIVPVESAVALLDPLNPQAIDSVELDASGNIVALDGQVLVIDEMRVSSFLAWETASGLLEQRISTDPAAAITLTELAYRAGRTDETVSSLKRAMSVISTSPLDERTELNDQLFAVVLDMVKPTTKQSILGAKDQLTLLDDLGELASTHTQVVAQRMELGSFNERRSNARGAIGAYQDILDEPALSASMWEGSAIAVRGGLEASRRIGAILETQGYAPYIRFSQLAETERTFITDQDNPVAYEQLARRYPWAKSTPQVWLDAASAWQSNQRTPAAIASAVQGIDASKALKELGVKIDQATIDELGERAITGMIATSRTKDAQALAASLSKSFPMLTLRINGQIITKDQIAERARLASQLPILGDSFLRNIEPILMTGSPIKPANRIDQGGIVLYAPQLGRVEYVRAGRGAIESVWSRTHHSSTPPIIPWQDESRTLILWPGEPSSNANATLEAIETTTGRVIWSVDSLRATLTQASTRVPDVIARNDGFFSIPTNGSTPINQLIAVTDGHTIVLTDRIGRAMGIDLYSGDRLWLRDLPPNRVHDLDLAGGVLGVCGLTVIDRSAQHRDGSSSSMVASLDPRTGEPIQIINQFGRQPRWIRVGSDGNLFIATNERVAAINTKGGNIEWVIHDERMSESEGGWIFGDQLIVLSFNEDLWALSLSEGTRSPNHLELRRRINRREWLDIHPKGDTLIVASSIGMAAFDHAQKLLAADPIEPTTPLIDVAWGLDRLAFLQTPTTNEQSVLANIFLLDQRDARLLDETRLAIPITLDRVPTSITAITGGLIVGYNEVSLFVRTGQTTHEN